MSNAFEWVTNGRAEAPPWIVCSIGVSTSRYSCAANVARRLAFTAARVRTVVRAVSRVMRSR